MTGSITRTAPRRVVIVDAYSTGRLLTYELAGRGAHLIHVQPRLFS